MPTQETSPAAGSSLEATGRAELLEVFRRAETADIKNSKDPAGLEKLLTESSPVAETTLSQVKEFAASRGAKEVTLPETMVSVPEVLKAAQAQIEILFPEGDERQVVDTLIQQYLQLVRQAMDDTGEYGLNPRLTTGTLWRLVQENIWVLAYQNHHSNSIFMGDHGLQHIAHDINVMRDLIRKQRELGLDIPHGAELAGMQALIIHDIKYPDLQHTPKGKANPLLEEGHPALAARIVQERTAKEDDLYSVVFPPAILGLIYYGVLTHDSTDFSLQGDYSPAERVIRSMRAADATAVYWGKLTLLLRHESMSLKTLEAMRLMQTAGEIGGEAEKEAVKAVRAQLREQVEALTDISAEARAHMLSGVETITPFDNRFELRRLAGTIPEYRLTDELVLLLTIEESKLNERLAQIFGRDLYQPLAKAVAEWAGAPPENVDLTRELEIVGKNPGVKVRVRKQLDPEWISTFAKKNPDFDIGEAVQPKAHIPHHEALAAALEDHKTLRRYAKADNELSQRQKEAKDQGEIEKIKSERLKLLRGYLETLNKS